MDDLRNSLQAAENHARQEIDRHNTVLKHILLAQHSLDLEELPLEEETDPNLKPEEKGLVSHPLLEEKAPSEEEGVPRLQVHGPEQRAKAERKWGAEPSELEVKFKTRYEKGTLTSCIVNVLSRMGEPVNSKKIHEELTKGGWKSNSKDSLMAVRNALVRMKGDIQSEKVEGIFHYSLLPVSDLV